MVVPPDGKSIKLLMQKKLPTGSFRAAKLLHGPGVARHQTTEEQVEEVVVQLPRALLRSVAPNVGTYMRGEADPPPGYVEVGEDSLARYVSYFDSDDLEVRQEFEMDSNYAVATLTLTLEPPPPPENAAQKRAQATKRKSLFGGSPPPMPPARRTPPSASG